MPKNKQTQELAKPVCPKTGHILNPTYLHSKWEINGNRPAHSLLQPNVWVSLPGILCWILAPCLTNIGMLNIHTALSYLALNLFLSACFLLLSWLCLLVFGPSVTITFLPATAGLSRCACSRLCILIMQSVIFAAVAVLPKWCIVCVERAFNRQLP